MPTPTPPRQRALANDVHIDWVVGSLTIAAMVYYLTDGSDLRPTFALSTYAPLDASPRELMNALAAYIIAQQPEGYDLSPNDIIMPSLERG